MQAAGMWVLAVVDLPSSIPRADGSKSSRTPAGCGFLAGIMPENLLLHGLATAE